MRLRHKQTGDEFEYDGPLFGLSVSQILLRKKYGLCEQKYIVQSHLLKTEFEQISEPGDSDFIGPVKLAGPTKPKRKYTKRKGKPNAKKGISSKV